MPVIKRPKGDPVLRIFHSISRRLKNIERYVGVPKPEKPFIEGLPSLDGNHWREAQGKAVSERAHLTRCVMDLRRHVLKIEEFMDELQAYQALVRKRATKKR